MENSFAQHDEGPATRATSAIKGDRERCLAASLDDSTNNPVEKEQSNGVLERFVTGMREQATGSHESFDSCNCTNDLSDLTPIDPQSLLERCFGDLDFAEALLSELETIGLERVEEIRRSAAKQDAGAAADAAHTLKGAAGILCAESVQQLAARIELAGRSLNIENIDTDLDELSAEMKRCLTYLPQLRQELNTLIKKRM